MSVFFSDSKYFPKCALILLLSFFFHILGEITVPGENDAFWYDKAYKSIQRAEILRGTRCGKEKLWHNFNYKAMAKNVILFVGDGMGMTTIAASRILKGQKINKTGEETYLIWENFPNVAFSRTYNTDHQVSDSAGTATAILCGVKTKMRVIGINDSCTVRQCDSVEVSRIKCLSDWFITQGKSVGLITNTRITHATPGSLYAKSADRKLEGYKDFATYKVNRTPEMIKKQNCMDIAWQLVNRFPGNALKVLNKVIMGGGWRKFLLENQTLNDIYDLSGHARQGGMVTEDVLGDIDRSVKNICQDQGGSDININSEISSNINCTPTMNLPPPHSTDNTCHGCAETGNTLIDESGRERRSLFKPDIENTGKMAGERFILQCRKDTNLIKDWINLRKSKGDKYRFVADKFQLNAVSVRDTDYLMGLFAHDHLTYGLKRAPGNGDKEPTLAEMVMKAMDVLENDPNGYFLLVEGGKIDIAHHEGKARLALEETVLLDVVVEKVYARIAKDDQDAPNETLLIVTADHSHVFNLGGYPVRGNPIFGFNREYPEKPYDLSNVDNLPYTSLVYGNGPGGVDPKKMKHREDLTNVDTADPDYLAQAAVPLIQETHGGEDVPIYATGPGSHLVYGVQEQNYIAHLIGYSSCVGPYANERCRKC
ncbi:alkaline phosphatase-like isoform X1 [Gordionus sp. m RMFG-2023]|uniref:alkaline phosphatase-like isoform X1 n=2 Tax=Gordionus sp. m RMFG-2023 TaxID=3053472 RepID=UPI0031FD3A2E